MTGQLLPRTPAGHRRIPAGRAIAALIAGLMLAGCAQQVDAGSRVGSATAGDSVSDQGYTSPDGATTIVAQADRKPVGSLRGQTLDGGQFDLADLRGEVVVLNVWASWCPPCRKESPTLAKVSGQLADSGVSFVGLNLKDSPEAARAFVRKVGIDYPSVQDPDGTLLLGLSADLPPTAIPATLVIDRQGRVAARALGEVDESRLRGMIDPILAEGPTPVLPSSDAATPRASGSSQ